MLRGLNLSAGRSEFARSVLEGIGFAIRDIIEIMEEMGAVLDELRVAGTSSGSGLLNRIKADITGKQVLVPQNKAAELLGLAIIGFCALGKYTSFAEAAGALVHIDKTYLPDGDNAALYNELFEKYIKMRDEK
jgi:sugar (pentulose or hexulose) kinase